MHACRVVLVRPQFAANLGATARVMRNFGLTDLVLVDAAADPSSEEARKLSTHGEDILDRCRAVADLGDAVADCVCIAATSARTGGLFRKQSAGTPEEILPRLVHASAAGPVALVFGPERTGLTNAEVSRCHWLVHIPVDAAYPALNLAQAVAICLYELHRAASGGRPFAVDSASSMDASRVPASCAEQERTLAHLRQGLEAIHFLYGDKADPLWHAVRHLLTRAGPSAMEVELLHGLARQLIWAAERGREADESRP